jgi:hypothetical protein
MLEMDSSSNAWAEALCTCPEHGCLHSYENCDAASQHVDSPAWSTAWSCNVLFLPSCNIFCISEVCTGRVPHAASALH